MNAATIEAFVQNIDWRSTAVFGLVLGRLSGAILGMPLFSVSQVPMVIRAFLVVLMAAAMYPGVKEALGTPPEEVVTFAILLVREFILGLLLGFAVRLVFAAEEMAGHLIAAQVGLTFGSIVHPDYDHQEPALVHLFHALTVLLFFALDGHHLFFRSLHESFTVQPPSLSAPLADFCKGLFTYGGVVFGLGVQIAAPVIAAVLLSNVGLGIVSRAAPSLQVFSISFALTILVGLAVLAATAPSALTTIVKALRGVSADVGLLLGRP